MSKVISADAHVQEAARTLRAHPEITAGTRHRASWSATARAYLIVDGRRPVT